MLYMTGHINYGGRVTDDWDRVCLLSILKKYYNQEVLNTEKYELSASKIYFVPEYGNQKSYLEYITKLPNFEDPEVFGMHENANITYQTQESNKIMETILSIQPRVSSSGTGGKSPD
jgi:dynein heavy chain